MASLKANILYNAGYKAFQILVPLVVTPYLSRTLGSEGIGYYSFTNAIASYFILFAAMGISTHGVRKIASVNNGSKETLSRNFWELYSCQLFTGLVALAAYVAYSFLMSGGAITVVLWIPYVAASLIDLSWFVFGLGEFRMPTIRNFILQIVSLVSVFFFVKSAGDVCWYVLITSLVSVASQVCLVPYVVKRVSFVRPSKTGIVENFKSNLMLFLPVIAISVYTSIDKVMLGSMVGMSENGYYTYAEKINSVVFSVLAAFGAVMLPKMTSLYSQGKNEEAKELIALSMWGMQALGWGMCFGLAGIAFELVPVFLGEDFIPCTIPLIALSFRIPVVAAENVFGNQYLLPLGMDKQYTIAVFLGAIVDVIVNSLLIPSLGSLGAAFGTIAAELTVFAFEVVVLRGRLPLLRYAKAAIPFCLLGVVLFISIRAISAVCSSVWGISIPTLTAEIAFGAIIFFLEIFVFARFSRSRQAEQLIGLVAPRFSFLLKK